MHRLNILKATWSAKPRRTTILGIISDYMGAPVEAYDSDGKKVWEQELDIYGKVVRHTGDVDFIPFRYQRQFQEETLSGNPINSQECSFIQEPRCSPARYLFLDIIIHIFMWKLELIP